VRRRRLSEMLRIVAPVVVQNVVGNAVTVAVTQTHIRLARVTIK